MKKALSLILALMLCFTLCACGNEVHTDEEETSTVLETEAEIPTVTIEDLSGTWSQSLWFLTTDLVLNANGTYDYGDNVSKGLATLLEEGTELKLAEKGGDDYIYHKNYAIYNNYIYSTGASFSGDTEYGLPFAPDENGRSNQEFYDNLDADTRYDPASKCNYLNLKLNTDGTFTLSLYNYHYATTMGMNVVDTLYSDYTGTYSYKDSILMLTYDGIDCPLVVVDGKIHYITYTKDMP